MQSQPIAPLPVSRSGVCVVDGYGVKIRAERGRLVVSDSIGPLRRASRFARATHGIRRLVVLGHTGFVSLDAIRWLTDVGIGFVQLDPDGRLLMASGGLGLDDPRLRRAQAGAFGEPVGMAVARALLDSKLAGQLRVAASMGASHEVQDAINRAAGMLRLANAPADLMVPEAAAASAYWSVWSRVELRWAKADLPRIPDLWRTFGNRASPLTGNSRLAANPANAVLNYLYALTEAEARLACLAMGLDPGLGVLHADRRARDSLALDVMEAVRPDVDAFLLDLLQRRTFRRAEFLETREGGCRIVAPLTHELAETVSLWRARLGPIVEGVARQMLAADSRGIGVPTRLTQAARSAGRDHVRRRVPRETRSSRTIGMTCRTCGERLIDMTRLYCGRCLPERIARQRTERHAAGQRALAELHATGIKPAHTPAAQASRARKRVESQRLAREWERDNAAPDPKIFADEILPRLATKGAADIARVTGLSRPYCSAILRGERVPHARWWEMLLDSSATD